MSETDFQTQVLKELKEMKGDISGIKGDIKSLDDKVITLDSKVTSLDGKFNRLDDRLDSVESNLSQEIKMQGAYLNQAFDRMNFFNQQGKAQSTYK